jgi:hypothetical protein
LIWWELSQAFNGLKIFTLISIILIELVTLGSLFSQRVYFIGNSFTEGSRPDKMRDETDYPAGYNVDVGWSTYQGSNLDYIVANPGDAFWSSGGEWDDELSMNDWDIVVMQIHNGDFGRYDIPKELAAAKTIIQTTRSNSNNAGTKFFIFGPWPWQDGSDRPPTNRPFEDNWTRAYPQAQIDNNTMFNSYQPLEGIFHPAVVADNPGAEIGYIPVGEVTYRVGRKLSQIPAPIPGLATAWDLFDAAGVHIYCRA